MPGEGGQVVSMAGQQTSLPSLRHQTTVVTSAPPTAHSHAHSSPKHVSGHVSGGRGVTRGAEQQYMIISSPNKKAKYSIAGGQHASILRNQLVTKDMVTGNNVEVKSEPLSMIGGNPGMRVTRGHRSLFHFSQVSMMRCPAARPTCQSLSSSQVTSCLHYLMVSSIMCIMCIMVITLCLRYEQSVHVPQ